MTKEVEDKYGIEDFAKMIGVLPSTARLKLRNAGIKKTGRSYTWPSKGAMEVTAEKLAKGPAKKTAPAKKKAPAKKASAPKKKAKSEGASAAA
jgi:hypothetical protein